MTQLNVPATLRKPLLSTNPIECSFDGFISDSWRAARWHTKTNQIQRWAASTLLDAEKCFCKVRGYREIPLLIVQLNKMKLIQERKVA